MQTKTINIYDDVTTTPGPPTKNFPAKSPWVNVPGDSLSNYMDMRIPTPWN